MANTEKELWEKIKNDDAKAFEFLYRHYFETLCFYSFGIVKNEESAEEIVNDVFFKVWSKRKTIEINYTIKSYLIRCIHNASVDFFENKRNIFSHKFTEIDEEINQLIADENESVLKLFEMEEMEEDIKDAIAQLPPQCRKIFYLSRYEFRSNDEISQALNISVNTVRTQISRALDSLRFKLKKYL